MTILLKKKDLEEASLFLCSWRRNPLYWSTNPAHAIRGQRSAKAIDYARNVAAENGQDADAFLGAAVRVRREGRRRRQPAQMDI